MGQFDVMPDINADNYDRSEVLDGSTGMQPSQEVQAQDQQCRILPRRTWQTHLHWPFEKFSLAEIEI